MHTKYVVFYVILTSLITGASCHMGTFSQGLYLQVFLFNSSGLIYFINLV